MNYDDFVTFALCDSSFIPSNDAADFNNGARFIPHEVTLARRQKQPVRFVQNCSLPSCWYWEFGDTYYQNCYVPGQRIYHFDRRWMEVIRAEHNGKCPQCGNTHITGATGEPLKRCT